MMAARLPSVHALSAFEAAARHNSFAVAAEELCITPSDLSHHIRLLEEFVGKWLFIRDGRAVTLPECGLRYLEVVRFALCTLPHFPLPCRRAQVQPRIKVTVLPTFARFMLVPHLAEFAARHAEMVIELLVAGPLYDLSLSESDVEVRLGSGNDADTVTEAL